MELCVVKVTKGNRNHQSRKLFYWPNLTKSLGLKVYGVHALPATAIARRGHELSSSTKVKQRRARFGLGLVTPLATVFSLFFLFVFAYIFFTSTKSVASLNTVVLSSFCVFCIDIFVCDRFSFRKSNVASFTWIVAKNPLCSFDDYFLFLHRAC